MDTAELNTQSQHDAFTKLRYDLAAQKLLTESMRNHVGELVKLVIPASHQDAALSEPISWQTEQVRAALYQLRSDLAEAKANATEDNVIINVLRCQLADAQKSADTEKAAREKAERALIEATRTMEQRYDCHGGPGTTQPECGACNACITRRAEKAERQAAEMRAAIQGYFDCKEVPIGSIRVMEDWMRESIKDNAGTSFVPRVELEAMRNRAEEAEDERDNLIRDNVLNAGKLAEFDKLKGLADAMATFITDSAPCYCTKREGDCLSCSIVKRYRSAFPRKS